MKKLLALFVTIAILSSCVTMESIRTTNRENLNKLSLGMTKQQALNYMGTTTLKTTDGSGDIVTNPWRTEILKGKDNESYEILFYYTDTKAADGAITDDELTPIILKENKVIGWGWSFLNDNVLKYQINLR